MAPAIIVLRFPMGSLPVKGVRCPECGEEILDGDTIGDAQDLARKLGLFGPEDRTRRKAIRVGGSVALTVDPQLAADLGIKPGVALDVGRLGDALLVRVAKK